jgi:hypothetical protein
VDEELPQDRTTVVIFLQRLHPLGMDHGPIVASADLKMYASGNVTLRNVRGCTPATAVEVRLVVGVVEAEASGQVAFFVLVPCLSA